MKAEHPALWITFSELDADHSGALDKVRAPGRRLRFTRLRRCPLPSVPVGRRPRPAADYSITPLTAFLLRQDELWVKLMPLGEAPPRGSSLPSDVV